MAAKILIIFFFINMNMNKNMNININLNVRKMAAKVIFIHSFLLLSLQKENIVDPLVIIFLKYVCLSEVNTNTNPKKI